MLCPEMKRVSVLRLNTPCFWKTKAGGGQVSFTSMLLDQFCSLLDVEGFGVFFSFQSFLIRPYQLLAAEGHAVQLIS